MPWQFDAENLVYKQPPETTGYTWKPMGQNENGTNPEGEWVANEGFDPTTLLNGRVDKYGRLDLTPREDLNAAEQRAYQLAYGSVDPFHEEFEVKSIDPNFNLKNNKEWWNIDPAYQNWWINEHSQNKGGALGTGGGLIGMRASEYITPAAILAAPFAIEALAPLSAAAAPAYDAAFAFGAGAAPEAVGGAASALSTGEILGSGGFTPTAGSSFAVDPLATYGAVASEAVPFVPEPTPYVPEPAPYVPEVNPYVSEPTPYVPESAPYVPESAPYVPESAPYVPEPAPYVPEIPQLTTPEILNSTGFTPTAEIPFTVDPSAAYTTGTTTSIPADIGMGTDAPLQGPTYQELGVTGVPEGGMGPTYAEMGNTGLNTEEAMAAADAAAKQSQLAEALKTANEVRQTASAANNLAKLLSPTAKNVAKTGTNANSQFINAAQNLAQFTPEQFGGYYQMNKNPFTFSNPMANALKNKDVTGFDVSGTGGQALNTTNQIANLLRMLG